MAMIPIPIPIPAKNGIATTLDLVWVFKSKQTDKSKQMDENQLKPNLEEVRLLQTEYRGEAAEEGPARKKFQMLNTNLDDLS